MTNKASIKPYTQAAGGWGALKSTAKHWMKSDNLAGNIKNLLRTNQPAGFDCPGCAWGDGSSASMVRFCENGAKAVNWEATSKRVDADFFSRHKVSWLHQQSDYFLEFQGRLTEPMRYNASTDTYQPIGWDEAFALIADHLQQLDSPDQAEFYTSGRASNEAAYLYQLMVRTYGTNNFPDCSNMCHEASGKALIASIGIGKGTVTLDDFEQADAIFVFGQNPGTNHPRMLDALRDASKHGARVVSFNNLKERGLERFTHPQNPVEMLSNGSTQISSDYYTPALGGDMAAVRGMVKHLLDMQRKAEKYQLKGVFDLEFIEQHTNGLDDYLAAVDATSWEQIEEQSGLLQHQLIDAAEIYAHSDRVICSWAMGLTQHKHSVDTIREVTNLLLLRGNIGKPGAGACPVRGHSNVQGDRTMGINDRPPKALLDSLEQHFNLPMPRENGHNTIEAIEAMLRGDSKVFIGLGGNFVAATPDTPRVMEAMRQCELTVNISTKLNRSHTVPGKDALILPCLGRTDIDMQASGEQCITVEDSMSMVHASAGVRDVLSNELRSEPAIIAGMAKALLGNHPVNWDDMAANYDHIRDLIEATIPGFQGFNEKIRQPGGFYLGNSAANRQWNTNTGKANFSSAQLPEELIAVTAQRNSKDKVFTLQTLRSHDQYNTTIYGMDDRYRGVFGQRKVLFMNVEDMKALGLENEQLVEMQSLWPDNRERKVTGFKAVAYDIPRGNMAAYYPETNPLVPLESIGDGSYTPTSKSIAIVVRPYEDQQRIA